MVLHVGVVSVPPADHPGSCNTRNRRRLVVAERSIVIQVCWTDPGRGHRTGDLVVGRGIGTCISVGQEPNPRFTLRRGGG